MRKINGVILMLSLAYAGVGCSGVTRIHRGGEAPDTLVVMGLGESQGKPQIARLGVGPRRWLWGPFQPRLNNCSRDPRTHRLLRPRAL